MSRTPSSSFFLPFLALLCLGLAGILPAAEPAPPGTPAAPPAGAPTRNIGGPGDYALREKLLHRLSVDPELAKIGVKQIGRAHV